jgi:hypothetical protein
MDEKEQIHILPLTDLRTAISEHRMSMNTLVFDNLVANRKEYINRWTVPLEESWMKRFV